MKIVFTCAILFLNVIFRFSERSLVVQKYIVKQKPREDEVNAKKKEL